jgi:hypothetical protein
MLAVLFMTGAGARADGPWCGHDVRGGTNCGFHSYAQCMASISGIGGYCARNPAYTGPERRHNRDQRAT